MSRGRRTLAQTLAAPRRLAAARRPGPSGPPVPVHGADSALGRLNAALVAGDDALARASYLALRPQQGADAGSGLVGGDPLALARRLARAHAWLGQTAPEDLLVRGPMLTEEDLRRLGAGRRAGDEAAELLARQENANGRGYPVPRDAGEFYRLARAVMATPSRFQLGHAPDEGGPCELKLRVSETALLELWRDPPSAVRRRVVLLRAPLAHQGRRELSVAVALEALVAGVPRRLVAEVRIGGTRAHEAAGRLRSAAGHIQRKHPELRPLLGELIDEDGMSTKSLYHRMDDTLDGAPEAILTELAGDHTCAHPQGRWELNGWTTAGPDCADTAVYRCPDCHRDQIAVAPLHRLPSGHALVRHLDDPERAEAYLARERFHRELAGDTRPITSLAGLRHREPVLVCEDGSPLASGAPDLQGPGGIGAALSGHRTRRRP